MASLWKHPKSQFWTACFTDDNGRQLKRSTKLTDRNKAMLMAQKYEKAYRMKLTESQARKVVSDIYEELHGEQLYHATVRKFFTDWLGGKQAEMSPGSHKRYKTAVDKLLGFLGERADRDIAYIHKRDISALRDKTATDLSPATANTDLKILRTAFRQAVVDGLRLDNPASAVAILDERREAGATGRRPFEESELKKLLTHVKGEWRGLVMGGLYTGQRLGDLASLTRRRVDFDQELIKFRSQKTARDMVIPIAAPLLDYLKKHIPTEPDGPFFPGAYATKLEANGESRLLSAEFHRLLVEAGLAKPRPKDKNSGRGHSVKRTVSELSFHSLRHNTTSWLKRAGVPESVVRDIIGHESELVSREYTHLDDDTKRKAIRKLPTLV